MLARILGPQDAKRYLDLRIKAAKEEPDALTFDVERELAQAAHAGSASMFLQEQSRIHWGVEHHGSLVGVMAASRRFNVILSSHLWLWGLYVRPRFRGTSVSRYLMEAALHWAVTEPWQDRLLSSFPVQNARAKRFLDLWGFQLLIEGERMQRIPGVLPGYVVMERVRSSVRSPGAASPLPRRSLPVS